MSNDATGGSDRQKILMLATAGLAGAVLIGMMVFVGGPGADLGRDSTPSSPSEQLILGERLYHATCAACHGDAGQGGVGPALDGSADVAPFRPDHLQELVRRGGERMPAIGPDWGEAEVHAISTYIERGWPTAGGGEEERGGDERRGAPSADR